MRLKRTRQKLLHSKVWAGTALRSLALMTPSLFWLMSRLRRLGNVVWRRRSPHPARLRWISMTLCPNSAAVSPLPLASRYHTSGNLSAWKAWWLSHHHLSSILKPWGYLRHHRWFPNLFLHFPLFSIALWDMANSRPVHSLMLSSHLFLCLPWRLPPFIVL